MFVERLGEVGKSRTQINSFTIVHESNKKSREFSF